MVVDRACRMLFLRYAETSGTQQDPVMLARCTLPSSDLNTSSPSSRCSRVRVSAMRSCSLPDDDDRDGGGFDGGGGWDGRALLSAAAQTISQHPGGGGIYKCEKSVFNRLPDKRPRLCCRALSAHVSV